MPNAPADIIPRIAQALKQGPANINKISKRAEINRFTVSSYLQAMEKAGFVKHKSEGRETIYMLRENPDSHFDLPIKETDKETFDTYYAYITEFCKEKFHKEPTPTQAHKVLWELNKALELNLPIGWYLHGPCAVQIYRGTETKAFELNPGQQRVVKETTEEYCALDPLTLQKKIYSQEKNKLYEAKEAILGHQTKEQLVAALLEFLRVVPESTKELATDFANTALLVEWKYTLPTFKKVWKCIGLIEFEESPGIKAYYQDIDSRLQPASFQSLSSMFLKTCSNMVFPSTDAKAQL